MRSSCYAANEGCGLISFAISFYSAATFWLARPIEYRRCTGVFASHGSFRPGLAPYSLIAGIAMDSYHRWMEVVAGPTLAGLPSLAVPAGFGSDGLPGGLQLIGPSQQDFAGLQLACAYEQTRPPWLSVLPPAAAISGTVSSGAPES